MDANPEVVDALRRTLRYFDRPLKRGELVREVSGRCRAHGWSVATWSRRIREAVAVLISEGIPVVSSGRGFYVASDRREMEAGIRRKLRAAITMLKDVAAAKRIPLHDLYEQLPLFEAAS